MTTELFRTIVDIPQPLFRVQPACYVLCVGSCFADNMGRRLANDHFPSTINPFGVMYNPASILHTIEKMGLLPSSNPPDLALLTLGTNHVYIERATGEIVDNCQKRPQQLFEERSLSVGECVGYLRQSIERLRQMNPRMHIVFTVSPIRYRKYGYHDSQLSKATLLLAVDEATKQEGNKATSTPGDAACAYFPAYEILNDELRDYRFYAPDMQHPSEQAVNYIYHRFQEAYFSQEARRYADEWQPIREALAHRPFHPESPDYQAFRTKTEQQLRDFEARWGLPEDR